MEGRSSGENPWWSWSIVDVPMDFPRFPCFFGFKKGVPRWGFPQLKGDAYGAMGHRHMMNKQEFATMNGKNRDAPIKTSPFGTSQLFCNIPGPSKRLCALDALCVTWDSIDLTSKGGVWPPVSWFAGFLSFLTIGDSMVWYMGNFHKNHPAIGVPLETLPGLDLMRFRFLQVFSSFQGRQGFMGFVSYLLNGYLMGIVNGVNGE